MHSVEVEKVTAEKALDYLSLNHHNPRPQANNIVNTWAREMEIGAWRLSNDALMFDLQGNLRNGQHRMKALISAAKNKPKLTLEFVVMRGCTEEERHRHMWG